MKRFLLSGVVTLCLVAFLQAQNALSRVGGDAEADWQSLSAKAEVLKNTSNTKPAGLVSQGKSATNTMPEKEPVAVVREMDPFYSIAREAHDFAKKNPSSSRLIDARKLEFSMLRRSVEIGATENTKELLDLAKELRSSKDMPLPDRFDIAKYMEFSAAAPNLKGKGKAERDTNEELVAEKLYEEFGACPQVMGHYLGVLRTLDNKAAVKLARDLAKRKDTPDYLQREASLIVDRESMVGKFVDLPLLTTQWQPFNLKALSGKVTVLIVWDGKRNASELEAFSRFRSLLPLGVRFVYLALGRTYNKPEKATPLDLAFDEVRCFEKPGLSSPSAQVLHFAQTPYVYVINAKGKLVGSGLVENLPALYKEANQ